MASFDIGTTKIGPKLRCFVHFDLKICFAPGGGGGGEWWFEVHHLLLHRLYAHCGSVVVWEAIVRFAP